MGLLPSPTTHTNVLIPVCGNDIPPPLLVVTQRDGCEERDVAKQKVSLKDLVDALGRAVHGFGVGEGDLLVEEGAAVAFGVDGEGGGLRSEVVVGGVGLGGGTG